MRRALRVQDNMPLWAGLQESGQVVPAVFLSRDPSYDEDTPRRRFVRAALRDLQQNLERLGSGLVVRYGSVVEELPRLAAEVGARAVLAAAVFDRSTLERDEKIRRALAGRGIDFITLPDTLLRQPGEVLTGSGQPYKVFTPFRRTWLAGADMIPGGLPKVRKLPPLPSGILSEPLPSEMDPGEGGETAALQRWKLFIGGAITEYAQRRDLPGIDGTSRVSSFLSHGAISVRRLYHDAMKTRRDAGKSGRASIDCFLTELVWREFYYHIAAAFPFVVDRAFREELAGIRWSTDRSAFETWAAGRTGYPIVDAALRQLDRHGWVHNRARMIAASFLTKDLQIDWRWGERLFLRKLVDADIASNNGGWQWTAGTGTDASPWFRIFNPVTQGKRFDPSGSYVRSYVPELASVPDRFIHAPWTMSAELQRTVGVVIGREYPAPMVDHAAARLKTLALYRAPKPRGLQGR
jgi:deoxyribodipyrimidine photo-lyase